MGKAKRQGLVDKVTRDKKNTTKKVNPFEIKVNKQKHSVLGKKVPKHDKGTPGISRSKAIKKRKETLLNEYKKQGKVNKFIDRRFGENDTDLSLEDKMLKRFAIERQKIHEKPGIFKLNDEDQLTHYGQSLSAIEKFETPQDISDNEPEDDEDQGRIGAQQVSEEHFGGFMKKKSDEETAKSWKERMEEMIAKSKKEKYERQHEKEETLQLTEKVDDEWKTVRAVLMSSSKKTKQVEDPIMSKSDDYDVIVKELQFEVKGQATDRLKTEEELATEEKTRLDKLEEDRLKRMKGLIDDKSKKSVHFSADDLNDGFSLDTMDTRFHVSYKDGKMLTKEDTDDDKEDIDDVEGDPDDVEEDTDDNEEDLDDNEEDLDDAEEDEIGEGSDGESDNHSDLESDNETDTDKHTEEESTKINKTDTKEDILKDLKERKEIMDAARKELPYTFKAPETYEDFEALLDGHTDEDQLVIVERLQKCHHPSLAEGNKDKLQLILTYLVEYYCDLAIADIPTLSLMEKLTVHLYSMCQMFPVHAGKVIVDQMVERQAAFSVYADRKGGRGIFPTLDTLLLLKLIPLLFPTSDFRHPVVTPAMTFMGQVLSQCPVQNLRDGATGLFICNILYEYVNQSTRYIPEVITFLRGLLFISSTKEPNKIEISVPPPFKPVGKNISLLELSKSCAKKTQPFEPLKIKEVLLCQDLRKLNTDAFRVSMVCMTVRLLADYSDLYKGIPSYMEIFQPVAYMVNKLPVKNYPAHLQNLCQKLLEPIGSRSEVSRSFLVKNFKKPQPLKQYEPKVAESFDGKKKRGGSRDFQEKQRLIHQHKKELKGAMREIRKDTQFLARQKLQETIEKDTERKRKVKDIYAMLGNQEGDWNTMQRKKNKLK